MALYVTNNLANTLAYREYGYLWVYVVTMFLEPFSPLSNTDPDQSSKATHFSHTFFNGGVFFCGFEATFGVSKNRQIFITRYQKLVP